MVDIRKKIKILTVFLVFLFLFPLHFFIMGEGYGFGIQGFLYRYQVSPYGISFIPLTNEIGYVLSGLIDGKSAISIILWSGGSVLFLSAFFFFFIQSYEPKTASNKKILLGIFFSCFFLIMSSFAQYGFFFIGSAGISIPFGIPVLLYFGWFLHAEFQS